LLIKDYSFMPNIRIIPRLDIKGENLIKGIHLEGLRVLGLPNNFALEYYAQGADELIYMDAVASLYGRNSLAKLISESTKNIFIPLTVGGGIRSIDNIQEVLDSGADKVAINTAAIGNPMIIRDAAQIFGSQSIVISIEAKRIGGNKWEAYTHNGREPSGLDVLDWVSRALDLGAGEVMITSVDREGTRKGYDFELIEKVARIVPAPLIVSGGMGSTNDCIRAVEMGCDGLAIATMLHYKKISIGNIKSDLHRSGITLRPEV